jgi:hypothetical protein
VLRQVLRSLARPQQIAHLVCEILKVNLYVCLISVIMVEVSFELSYQKDNKEREMTGSGLPSN